MIRVAIITVSDKGSKGQREDISGQTIRDIVEAEDWEVVEYRLSLMKRQKSQSS